MIMLSNNCSRVMLRNSGIARFVNFFSFLFSEFSSNFPPNSSQIRSEFGSNFFTPKILFFKILDHSSFNMLTNDHVQSKHCSWLSILFMLLRLLQHYSWCYSITVHSAVKMLLFLFSTSDLVSRPSHNNSSKLFQLYYLCKE